MAAGTAPTSAVLLPLSSSSSGGSKAAVGKYQQRWPGEGQRQQRQQEGLASSVARVVRQDREFFTTKLEQVAAPIHQLRGRVSKALDYFFWLRFLEEEGAGAGASPSTSPPWPSPSYKGLSGMDLLMADFEALKLYVSYLHYMAKPWSMPLPETYEPQTVQLYFKCRPHILGVRILEVLFSFLTAAIKVRASRSKIGSHHADKHINEEASQYYIGRLLKDSILNLGPTFIKVGQSLSTRPDIIGPGIAKALSELYDKVPPFSRSIAMKTVENELGCPVEDAFSYISEEPVAAASFGQVYQGCTCDGYMVAVKVQRPDLLHAVVRDIYILRIGLGILRKIAKRKSDPRLYADELGKGFVGELDYRLEAANATEFRVAHAKYPFISAPMVFKHLSGKKVLTMEWLVGENPNDLLSLSRRSARDSVGYTQQLDAKKRVLDLVNKGVEASLVQLLETGILHADPHPGNLRYTPEGNIGFLDFGLLCRMQKKHQLAMLASIVHIVNGDWGSLVQDLTEMDVVPPTTNVHCVTMDLEEALSGVAFKDGIPDIKFSRVPPVSFAQVCAELGGEQVCASASHRWARLNMGAAVGEDVRVMTCGSEAGPGEPPGVVLSAATSVWVPLPPRRLFDFLRNEALRSEWDILSNGAPMQEVAHITKGQDQGNAVSLLRASVLGKIWSIALKYHCRMPPYYTLVLRSLASLEGLAVATDQDFRAFQAAYPYVVQQLLYNNSTATRRILYSVVFNKRREFQWQKVSLFLQIGSSRNGNVSPCNIHGRHSIFDAADLILKLLPSKDGVVLRRLLMDADAASLAGGMVSKEAAIFRRHMSRALADVICQWITSVLTRQRTRSQYVHDPVVKAQNLASVPFSPLLLATLKDRRVKVISYRVLCAIRGDPALILRVCWAALTVLMSSLALASHRLLVSLENLSSPLPFVRRLFAVGA